MLKRIAILSLAAFGLMTAPALAEDTQYPPTDEEELTVSANAQCPGDSLVDDGRGFAPGSSVLIELVSNDTNLGSATTDDAGDFSFEATVPETQEPGDYTVQATGTNAAGDDVVLTAALTVEDCDEVAPPAEAVAPPADDLPVTGSNSTMLLIQIGLALAAIGGILLTLARRRKTTQLRTA
jgi:alpha-L-rhamnosidase